MLDSDLVARLLSAVWEMQLAVPANSSLCAGRSSESGRQLWEIFIRLDTGEKDMNKINTHCSYVN